MTKTVMRGLLDLGQSVWLTESTVTAVRRLWHSVNRPNAMVTILGTRGLVANRTMSL